MRQEYVIFNPKTIRGEKLRPHKEELQRLEEQFEKEKERYQYSDEKEKPVTNFFLSIATGGVGGLIAGSFMCVGVALLGVQTGLIPLTFFFGLPIVGTVMAYRSSITTKKDKEKKDRGMAELLQRHESAVKKIQDEVDYECREFVEGFEKEVSYKIEDFPQPPISQSWIQKFAKEFGRKILSANRSSGIEKIEISFVMRTYAEELCSEQNKYLIMKEMFRPLEGFAEQTALARSVASAVQVEVMTLLASNQPDSQYDISADETYEGKATVITLIYRAKNDHFQEMRSW